MIAQYRNVFLKHFTACLVTLVLSGAWAIGAHAQSTPSNILLQFSTLTASDDTITAIRVPILTADGTTIYKNITLQLVADASGNLTIASGSPAVVPSVAPIVSNFMAGNYIGPSNNSNFLLAISGPGTAMGGATEWSLTSSTGANSCTSPSSATWFVGPLENNPLAARLEKAGITTTAWSYGVGGNPVCNISPAWQPNSLLGFSQTGNALTIVSFTYNGTDHSTPTNQITYTLAP
jgi:hypothetical protein